MAEENSPLLETTTTFKSYKTVSFDLAKGTVDYPTDENTRCVSRIQKDGAGVLLDEDGDPSIVMISLENDKVISFNAYMGTFSEYNKMFLLSYDDTVDGYKFEANIKKLIKLMEQHGYNIFILKSQSKHIGFIKGFKIYQHEKIIIDYYILSNDNRC